MTTYTLTTFSDGDTLLASEMNDNFQYCLADTTTKVGALETSVQGSIDTLGASVSSLQTQVSNTSSYISTYGLNTANDKNIISSEAVNRIVTTAGISKAQNGYVKFGNGLIVQWGYKSDLNSSTNKTISFPTSFTSSNYCISLIGYDTSHNADSNTQAYCVRSRSASSCTVSLGSSDGQKNGSFWMAVGY